MPLDPIGTLLKFFDPASSPFAVVTIAAGFSLFFTQHQSQDEEWPIYFWLLTAILAWTTFQSCRTHVAELKPPRKAKEPGLCIALLGLISITAVAATLHYHFHPEKSALYLIVIGTIAQLSGVHLLASMQSSGFFTTNRFHITQFTWTVAALFVGWVFAALIYESPSEARTDIMANEHRQIRHIGCVFLVLWAVSMARLVVLRWQRPTDVAETTTPPKTDAQPSA